MDISQGTTRVNATRPRSVVSPAPLDPKAELARIRTAAGLPENLNPAIAAKVGAFLWPKRFQARRAA